MKKPELSVIAPVWNENESLNEFVTQVAEVLDGAGESWELVLVDDGSTDGSTDIIRNLAARDQRIRPVVFARNFGHQIAVTAGMDYSQGKVIIIIDADLQDPPEVMLEMLAKWREGNEVVYAVRETREGESVFKRTTAKFFYRLINALTDTNIPVDTGDFRLMDRCVVDVMNGMRERHRFIRGLSAWVGFKQVPVYYHRNARFAGKTHYPLRKMIKLALTAITGFSYVPLQVATYMGFVAAVLGLLFIPFVIIMRLSGSQAFLGQATTLTAVLFFGGVQLVSLGILGEYIGRLYDEARGRPLYVTRETPDED
ncbi:MAG: glycosyltransferase family 2 protein [Anaerolineales bacterium]|nr:glycosyltransferase family 2 protein [Anaerolineales bacterium]